MVGNRRETVYLDREDRLKQTVESLTQLVEGSKSIVYQNMAHNPNSDGNGNHHGHINGN